MIKFPKDGDSFSVKLGEKIELIKVKEQERWEESKEKKGLFVSSLGKMQFLPELSDNPPEPHNSEPEKIYDYSEPKIFFSDYSDIGVDVNCGQNSFSSNVFFTCVEEGLKEGYLCKSVGRIPKGAVPRDGKPPYTGWFFVSVVTASYWDGENWSLEVLKDDNKKEAQRRKRTLDIKLSDKEWTINGHAKESESGTAVDLEFVTHKKWYPYHPTWDNLKEVETSVRVTRGAVRYNSEYFAPTIRYLSAPFVESVPKDAVENSGTPPYPGFWFTKPVFPNMEAHVRFWDGNSWSVSCTPTYPKKFCNKLRNGELPTSSDFNILWYPYHPNWDNLK